MKINVKRIFIALCAIGVMLAATACVDQDVKRLKTEAGLVQLWIGTVIVTDIPAAIPQSTWESDNPGILFGEDFKGIQFLKESDITGARIRPVISEGATAEYGIGTRGSRPDIFYDTRVPATFGADDFIYIKVTAEDVETVNYYRYSASVFSWVTDLANVSIVGGVRIAKLEELDAAIAADPENKELAQEREQLLADRRAKANTGSLTASNAPVETDTDNKEDYILFITSAEAGNAIIMASTFDPNATFRYATTVLPAGGFESTPEFVPAGTPIPIQDGFIYVEVTAQNTIDKKYFKFRVYVGRISTIKSLEFTTEKGTVEVYGKGLPKKVWGTVGPGSFATASVDQPADGFGINVELDDSTGSAVYTVLTSIGKDPPAVNSSDWKPISTGLKVKFNPDDFLVIRVQSELGSQRRYYQIKITLQAANVITQPKSAWYYATYVTDGVDPAGKKSVASLTIELDPPDNGQYTYQWYESDSLFGIYGRHGLSLDEKNNISTINGGPDMYYYLVQPGITQFGVPPGSTGDQVGMSTDNPKFQEALAWEADVSRGAKTKTYTPRTDWKNAPIRLPGDAEQNKSYPVKPSSPLYNVNFPAPVNGVYDAADTYHLGPNLDIDKKPFPDHADNLVNFFAGSTSEVRYYWVVVTGGGLTVTSDRAVILTESDGKTKHFIFELTDLPRRKNIVPFAYLRQPHDIPIPEGFFPAGFNPTDYDGLIAQAQYYLPDGRPWTQNWTHGDLRFGYTPGSASYELNGGPLTWWHNNLGSNSGAIPLHTPHSAQGGLLFPPDWIGFQPSGDKSRGLPDPWNNPFTHTQTLPIGLKPEGYTEGIAQGYFCGFIELMEVRFVKAPPKN